jgi:DNA-binding NarL/FixJ family response regulator
MPTRRSATESTRIELVGTTQCRGALDLSEQMAFADVDVLVVGQRRLDPRASAGALTERMARHHGLAVVLLCGSYKSDSLSAFRELMRARESGFALLLKQDIATGDDFEKIVLHAADGRIIIDPNVADSLMESSRSSDGRLSGLTAREVEILEFMAAGYRNAAIADSLVLEPKTVERHINNIYRKLFDGEDTMHPRVSVVNWFTSVAAGGGRVRERLAMGAAL